MKGALKRFLRDLDPDRHPDILHVPTTFQPEPEAGDLPFPTTRRGWVAGATEHEPSGAPSRRTPGGRRSAVGGESDAAGAGDELRGRDLAVVDGVDDDRVGDQWAKLLSERMPLWPPPNLRSGSATAPSGAVRSTKGGRRVTPHESRAGVDPAQEPVGALGVGGPRAGGHPAGGQPGGELLGRCGRRR